MDLLKLSEEAETVCDFKHDASTKTERGRRALLRVWQLGFSFGFRGN